MTKEETRNFKEFRIYKRKPQEKGSCIGFSLKDECEPKSRCVFMQMANQKGEMNFDYENDIIVKLNTTDISAMLSVIEGYHKEVGKDGKGLFHKHQESQTTIYFKKVSQGDEPPRIQITLSKKENNSAKKSTITLLAQEIICVRELLRWAIVRIAGWA